MTSGQEMEQVFPQSQHGANTLRRFPMEFCNGGRAKRKLE